MTAPLDVADWTDVTRGPGAEPGSRLYGTAKWKGQLMHFHAIEVELVDGKQQAKDPAFWGFFIGASALFEASHFEVREIGGREYAIFTHPARAASSIRTRATNQPTHSHPEVEVESGSSQLRMLVPSD